MTRLSSRGDAQRASRQNTKAARAVFTTDSFQNFAAKLGIGADNLLSGGSYGFNPITKIRTLLEWIYRGSWLGGVAIDIVADDMTRAGVEIVSTMKPDDTEKIQQAMTRIGVAAAVNDVIKWGRLYGGGLGVYMIDGHKWDTPLRVETVGPGQFKGILALDRWMVDPTLNDLVVDPGPDFGLPKFYNMTSDVTGLPRRRIHYTRCFRYEGVRLPYWQRVMENLWGISVFERLYDRMVAFDSASTGMAQLTFKAHLRTYKVKDLRKVVSKGGELLDGLVKYVDMMRKFQSIEGITLLDMEDEFAAHQLASMTGMSDAILQLGQQLSGALQIPLVRMFGQSPAGLNSTGESDLRTYYDGIRTQQERWLRTPYGTVLRLTAGSEGIKVPESFHHNFAPLWQMEDKDKVTAANQITQAVSGAVDSGLVKAGTGLRELRQSSRLTGVWSNITDEEIEDADEAPPRGVMVDPAEAAAQLQEATGGGPDAEPDEDGLTGTPGDLTDEDDTGEADLSDEAIASAFGKSNGKGANGHDAAFGAGGDVIGPFQIVIETPKGERRQPHGAVMLADYGYVRKTGSAEGSYEPMDCFVGPHRDSDRVFVIHQADLESGDFDEHKLMFAYNREAEARADYAGSFNDGHGEDRIQRVDTMSLDDTAGWLERNWPSGWADVGFQVDRAGVGFEKVERGGKGSGHGGQFRPGGGGTAAGGAGPQHPSPQLRPASERAFAGKQVEGTGTLSKLEAGALGEKIAAGFLRHLGLTEVRGLNVNRNNFPVDLVTEKGVVEVKAGLATNGKSAQHWRSTIGQPGIKESEWLRTATPAEKSEWNNRKAQAILDRKEAAAKAIEEETGQALERKMVGVIINPETKTADVYLFDGFHSRIAWNSAVAASAYKGSFQYA